MNKRLAMLEKLTASGTADAFGWYALAMEYRKEGRLEDSLRTFQKLRAEHASYVPMYLMAGQMLIEAERSDEAREWLTTGIAAAKQAGDSKALGELQTELANLG